MIKAYIIRGDVTELKFNSGHTALIDTSDLWWVKEHNWSATKSSNMYVRCYRGHNKTTIHGYSAYSLHRHILHPKGGELVDHISHDTLDNRRSNLRVCNLSQNRRNSTSKKTKGVSKSKLRWRAELRTKEAYYYLGQYKTEREAALAYDRKAKELFGEFACLNFPEETNDVKQTMG